MKDIDRWREALVEASKTSTESSISLTLDGETVKEIRRIGATYWFEFRCTQAHWSEDAHLWYRSHQQVELVELSDGSECPVGETMHERIAESGMPLTYQVRFSDGEEWSVTEDELLDTREQFELSDPPKGPDDTEWRDTTPKRSILDRCTQ